MTRLRFGEAEELPDEWEPVPIYVEAEEVPRPPPPAPPPQPSPGKTQAKDVLGSVSKAFRRPPKGGELCSICLAKPKKGAPWWKAPVSRDVTAHLCDRCLEWAWKRFHTET